MSVYGTTYTHSHFCQILGNHVSRRSLWIPPVRYTLSPCRNLVSSCRFIWSALCLCRIPQVFLRRLSAEHQGVSGDEHFGKFSEKLDVLLPRPRIPDRVTEKDKITTPVRANLCRSVSKSPRYPSTQCNHG